MLNNACKGCSGAKLVNTKWTCIAEGGAMDCLGVDSNDVIPLKSNIGKFEEMISNIYLEYGIREVITTTKGYMANIYSVNERKSIYFVTADKSMKITDFHKFS